MRPPTPLELAFLSGDYRRFNAEPGRSGGFLARLTITGRTLRHFDLSGVHLAFCTFVGVEFYDLDNVDFTTCTFKGCRFQQHGSEPLNIRNSQFVRCTFLRSMFEEANITGVKFKQCYFQNTSVTPEGCVISDTVFNDCQGVEHIHGISNVSLPNSVSYRPYSPAWPAPLWRFDKWFRAVAHWFDVTVNWRTLAFFSRLPILNVSYVFLVALTAYVIMMGSFLDLVSMLIQRVPEAIKPALRPEEAMAWVRQIAIPRAEALWIVGAFILLAIAGTIYKLCAPTQVQEYSQDKWVLELDRHRLNYAAFVRSKPWAYLIATLLTLAAAGIAGFVTASKFGLILWALRV